MQLKLKASIFSVLITCSSLCLAESAQVASQELPPASTQPATSEDAVISNAKAIVSAEMKDPESAQFKELTKFKVDAVDVVCGKVNAKNSYGGYVGFRPFIVLDKVVFLRENNNIKEFNAAAAYFCKASGL